MVTESGPVNAVHASDDRPLQVTVVPSRAREGNNRGVSVRHVRVWDVIVEKEVDSFARAGTRRGSQQGCTPGRQVLVDLERPVHTSVGKYFVPEVGLSHKPRGHVGKRTELIVGGLVLAIDSRVRAGEVGVDHVGMWINLAGNRIQDRSHLKITRNVMTIYS